MRQTSACPWPELLNLSLLSEQKGAANTDYQWAIWCMFKKPKKAALVECEIPWICHLFSKPCIQLLTYFNTCFNAHLTEILEFPVLLENPSAWQRWVWNSLGSSGPKEFRLFCVCSASIPPKQEFLCTKLSSASRPFPSIFPKVCRIPVRQRWGAEKRFFCCCYWNY